MKILKTLKQYLFLIVVVISILILPNEVKAAEKNVYSLLIGGINTSSIDDDIITMNNYLINNKLSPFDKRLFTKIFRFDCDRHGTSVSELNTQINSAYSDAQKEDIAIFYYSGHGQTTIDNSSSRHGLALNNDNKPYQYKELAQKLSSTIRCEKIVVILDACFAQAFYEEGIRLLPETAQKKFTLLLSSGANETSLMSKGTGLFTYSLYQSISTEEGKSKSDENKDGVVSLRELMHYSENVVSQYSSEQHPFFYSQNMDVPFYASNSVSITLNKNKLSLWKGKKYKLSTMTTEALDAPKICSATWSSSNPSIASVTSDGTVTAKKAGTATIYAKKNNVKIKCTVTVKNPTIKLSKSTMTIQLGDTVAPLEFYATVKGPSSKVKWTSSNPAVATINSKGNISTKKLGKTTITALANGVSAKCSVTVIEKKISLSFKNKPTKKLVVHSKWDLDLMVDGKPASYDKTTWKSSNPAVASVNHGGIIVAKEPGSTVITATYAKKKSIKLTVNVVKPTPRYELKKMFEKNIYSAASNMGLTKKRETSNGCLYYASNDSYVIDDPLDFAPGITIYCTNQNDWNEPGKWNIAIRSGDFTLYGMQIGMTESECKTLAKKAGFVWKDEDKIQKGASVIDLEFSDNHRLEMIDFYPDYYSKGLMIINPNEWRIVK